VKLRSSDPRLRALVYQVSAAAATLLLGWFLISNTIENLAERNIASGFAFLDREAGFAIGETTFVPYSASGTYLEALTVGIANTLRVALIGIVAATVLGSLIGLARLSRNWLLAKLASGYVEFIRNVPLLVQLFFFYALIAEHTPVPREAIEFLPGWYLSNRGMFFPVPVFHAAHAWALAALAAGIATAVAFARWAARRRALTGGSLPVAEIALALVLGPPALTFIAMGTPLEFDVPRLSGFNFSGGVALTPEFTALTGGLILYTAAFIAEIVRAGILSIPRGQIEAACALGLRQRRILRFVILPQALRVIVPPLTNQYLNLTKNSSLAVAIGYPDLVSVANTTINQTGQAVEGVAIIMAVYLTITLTISVVMNWYNARMALRGQ